MSAGILQQLSAWIAPEMQRFKDFLTYSNEICINFGYKQI